MISATNEFYNSGITELVSAQTFTVFIRFVPFVLLFVVAFIWVATGGHDRLHKRVPQNAVIPAIARELIVAAFIALGGLFYTFFFVDFRPDTRACQVAKHMLQTRKIDTNMKSVYNSTAARSPDVLTMRDIYVFREECGRSFVREHSGINW